MTLDLLQTLRNSQHSPIAVFGEFLIGYKPRGKTLHVFFEGPEDEAFYRTFLESKSPEGYRLYSYRCKNKKDVYKTADFLANKVKSNGRTLFFVDKDLSDFLPEVFPKRPNIFVTEFYSIENYVVTAEMARRLCREYFHIYDHKTLKKVETDFGAQYSKFTRYMRHIMAWIITAHRNNEIVHSANVSIDDLCELSQGGFQRVPSMSTRANINQYLTRKTSCTLNFEQQKECAEVRQEIQTLTNAKAFLRGKWDLWFFYRYLEFVKSEHDRTRAKGTEKSENLPPLSQAMMILGPRVKAWPGLIKFIGDNWGAM